ncbi:MAG: hypothetical protein ACK4GQ_04735 [Candidatus Hadarchaeales archaeon]
MRPRPITVQDLPNTPEIFLGLSGLLVLVVGASESSVTTVIQGLIMCCSALISLGVIESPLLRGAFSMLTISTVFGVLLFFQWLEAVWRAAGIWQTWVVFIAALLSLYAAWRGVLLKRF